MPPRRHFFFAFFAPPGHFVNPGNATLSPAAQQQRNAELAQLADFIPQLAWMAGADGALTWYNARWYEYTGTTFADMQGWGWQKVHHPDHVERVTALFKKHVASGEPWEDLFPLRSHTGEYRWFLSRALPVRDAEGRVVRWFGTNTDVTEAQQMEEALRESEARFRSLADAAPAMLWVTDAAGACTFISRGWCELTGQSELEARERGWMEAIHPDDRAQADAGFGQAIAQQQSFRLEYRLRRSDGVYRWVIDTGEPRWAASGAFRGHVGAVVDITERKEAEDAVRARERYFSTLAEAIPDIVFTCDELGRLDYFNPRWYAYTGLDPAELAEDEVLRRVHPDDLAPARARWHEAFGAGQPAEVQLRLRSHEGDYRWFLVRVVPVHEKSGEISRWFGSGAEIQAQKMAEETLEARVAERTAALGQANETLEQRNRELQDFAYVASHDLQEPLRKILTFTDLFVGDYGGLVPDEGRHFLSRVQDAARRMSRLINDLLAFSRVSTQQATFRPVNLQRKMEMVLADLEVRIAETGARVDVQPMPTLVGDATQLRQLLQNLVGNALKYRKPGVAPFVQVRSQIVEGEGGRPFCRIEVEDNGIGFDEKYLDRIFAPFQRLHTRGQYEGTGIGLAICRRIVERHGGTLTARSTPDVGSVFIATLPLEPPEAPQS